jgi:hypothetical protein
MLDAKPAALTKFGKVTIEAGWVTVEGFHAAGGSCRDVAALGMLWAIGQLQFELMRTLEHPGAGNVAVD